MAPVVHQVFLAPMAPLVYRVQRAKMASLVLRVPLAPPVQQLQGLCTPGGAATVVLTEQSCSMLEELVEPSLHKLEVQLTIYACQATQSIHLIDLESKDTAQSPG